jgi:acetoin:2,6-dichlorophenolindophenol oxidoreductase subunit alpha
MASRQTVEQLKWIYSKLTLIREFEQRIYKDYLNNKLPGFVHMYAGEEAVAVGVCALLRENDFITSTHRGHGHCIAKGVDPKHMMAELYGKATGTCKGKGGSMHIADIGCGMLGANGIVVAGLPLACGAALSAKVRKTDQVAAAFFGDGSSNSGAFHESLNLAAVLKLPVIFVLENNGYADATPIRYAATIENLSERARSYGIPGITVDGMDVFAVMEATEQAVARARKGNGPSLVECKTYRYYGHFVGDACLYRSKEEVEEKKKHDCILNFEEKVLAEGWLSKTALQDIQGQSAELIEESVSFAERSAAPELKECLEDVYVSY